MYGRTLRFCKWGHPPSQIGLTQRLVPFLMPKRNLLEIPNLSGREISDGIRTSDLNFSSLDSEAARRSYANLRHLITAQRLL